MNHLRRQRRYSWYSPGLHGAGGFPSPSVLFEHGRGWAVRSRDVSCGSECAKSESLGSCRLGLVSVGGEQAAVLGVGGVWGGSWDQVLGAVLWPLALIWRLCKARAQLSAGM